MTLKLTNEKIYEIGVELRKLLNDETIYFPARLNFFLLKNYYEFVNAIKTLEKIRDDIVEHYGVVEDNQIKLSEEQKQQANAELESLLMLEQSLDINPIKLSWVEGLQFTAKQMEALYPMIEED